MTDGNAKEDYVSFSEALEETINEIDANSNRPDGVCMVYRLTLLSFDELTGGLARWPDDCYCGSSGCG